MIWPQSRDQGISLSILADLSAIDGRGRGIFFESADNSDANSINIMATLGRGIVSAALSAGRAYQLGLTPLKDTTQRDHMPMYITSVEAAACTETGISASERALTIRTLGNAACTPNDLVTPGHIMPAIIPNELPANPTLATFAYGYANSYVDAAAIAWCDILNDEGETATAEECIDLAERLKIPALMRRGDDVVDVRYLQDIGERPELRVGGNGLPLGQFA